ncbi:hypothetical protein FIE12Z_1455 [Fusarium flagelliforme]|uniref:Uncharacterized protein n=1 Tax=Fusarium flagelliforme TaxID=2675880 RepID=A0A395N416_9HYPO|nr:hypothetical protein FIE12Z_1455 [Fusarium flagelliforme]
MADSLQTVGRSTKSPQGFASLARASSRHLFKKRDETPAICFEDCTDNTEDSQKTEQDYVEPQFQQFLNYCEEQSTSVASFTLTGTIWVTLTTPAPCEACIVTTALDYKSRPIVYTLGTQPATEVLKYFPSPVATSSSTPNASGPDIAAIIGPVVPSAVLLLLLGFLLFRWYKRRGMKKAEQGPMANEEEPKGDKPQLHSDCIARPTFELEGSTLTLPEGNNRSMKEESEMPANEPAAHEMSADKKISIRIRVESVTEES